MLLQMMLFLEVVAMATVNPLAGKSLSVGALCSPGRSVAFECIHGL